MNYELLTGRRHEDLFLWDAENQVYIHQSMKKSLEKMRQAARAEGIEIAVASGFRSYERQLKIWNAKAQGKRKLRNRKEEIINMETAKPEEILESILTWSAVPGASRHHWGTEIDVFDQKVKEKQEVLLTQKECESEFCELYAWLDENLANYSFHRPYQEDLGGVAREPWHLSYTPLSLNFQEQYSIEVFEKNIEESDLELKDLVRRNLDEIYRQYIANIKNL